MATNQPSLTSTQARYVIDRLLADRRISPAEVAQYVAALPGEIRALEERLASLRATANGGQAPAESAATAPKRGRTRRRSAASAKKGANPQSTAVPAWRKLQGSYIGYLRQFPESKRGKYQRIAKKDGRETAIMRMKKALGK